MKIIFSANRCVLTSVSLQKMKLIFSSSVNLRANSKETSDSKTTFEINGKVLSKRCGLLMQFEVDDDISLDETTDLQVPDTNNKSTSGKCRRFKEVAIVGLSTD